MERKAKLINLGSLGFPWVPFPLFDHIHLVLFSQGKRWERHQLQLAPRGSETDGAMVRVHQKSVFSPLSAAQHTLAQLNTSSSRYMGVSENVVYPEKPNGFADHYPVSKWLAIIGNINPTFSDIPISILRSKFLHVFRQHGAPEHLGPKLVGDGFSQLVIGDGPAARGLPGGLGEKSCSCYWGPMFEDRKAPMGLSENVGYIPNYTHLIGIMIINHWV